ncbi:MAG: cytochrome c oxidase subunit II [Bacteroidetes bacterium]|nr:cytochrome c oxidase subunit II [Bacteroidota bacterium]
MALLIFITVVLVVVAIAKIMRSHELATKLNGDQEDFVSLSEIKTQGFLYVLFGVILFTLIGVQMYAWGKYILPSSASVHGDEIDNLFDVTMNLILVTFFITHTVMFAFIYKYYQKKGQKAFWFPHNNKLEMAWTIIPAIVLLSLITYGLSTWSDVMYQESTKDSVKLEVVAEQFKWTVRYSGKDRELGKVNFSTITGSNALGIMTAASVDSSLVDTRKQIAGLERSVKELDSLVEHGWSGKEDELSDAESKLSAFKANERRLLKFQKEHAKDAAYYRGSEDDVIVRDTLYLAKDRMAEFTFRSKDVLHSAYFPHFRAQMNCVPGQKTYFTFTPKYTSEEMKEVAASEGKNFVLFELVCNKICGASHYKMRFPIVVLSQKDFDARVATYKTFGDEFAGK